MSETHTETFVTVEGHEAVDAATLRLSPGRWRIAMVIGQDGGFVLISRAPAPSARGESGGEG